MDGSLTDSFALRRFQVACHGDILPRCCVEPCSCCFHTVPHFRSLTRHIAYYGVEDLDREATLAGDAEEYLRKVRCGGGNVIKCEVTLS